MRIEFHMSQVSDAENESWMFSRVCRKKHIKSRKKKWVSQETNKKNWFHDTKFSRSSSCLTYIQNRRLLWIRKKNISNRRGGRTSKHAIFSLASMSMITMSSFYSVDWRISKVDGRLDVGPKLVSEEERTRIEYNWASSMSLECQQSQHRRNSGLRFLRRKNIIFFLPLFSRPPHQRIVCVVCASFCFSFLHVVLLASLRL